MEDLIRVVVVDDTARTVENLRRLLSFESDLQVVGSALTAGGALAEARKHSPDVLLMDVNLPDMDGIRATELLSLELPQVPVILISVQDDREYLRRAMEAGARQYLIKPFSADELVAAIRRVHAHEVLKRRPPADARSDPRRKPVRTPAGGDGPAAAGRPARSSTRTPASPRSDPATAEMPAIRAARQAQAAAAAEAAAAPPAPADPAVAAPPLPNLAPAISLAETLSTPEPQPELPPIPPPIRRSGTTGIVTVVFSGKGGVGKSVVAVNLAAALVRETGQSVALVDLDLQFGDISVMLGLDPAGTLADVSRAFADINAPMIGALMPETAGGVRVLASPLSPELADLITSEHVRATIGILRDAFDHVVIDTSSTLNDISLDVLERADKLLLITDLTVPAIKDAMLVFKVIDQLSIPRERVHLVVNRSDTPSAVTFAQVEANLRYPVSVRVPSLGKLVLQSIQKGVPVIIQHPDSEIALKMRELVGRLIPLANSKGGGGRRAAKRRLWPRSTAS